ncbi:MAG: type I methionyl aminopeptidase [Candidatus Berkelbacteria bacterium]
MSTLSPEQIDDMKVCGKILKNALDQTVLVLKAGVTTIALDRIAEESIVNAGARPSFKNYFVEGVGSYPSSLCVSINDEVVHGIPNESRVIKNGDVVSLDLGAEYHGVCTDMARTIIVGEATEQIKSLVNTTRICLENAIKEVAVGKNIGNIGAAVEKTALAAGFAVIKDYVGHGIGEKPHMAPSIPNFGKYGSGPKILDCTALAIEPMITLSAEYTTPADDGWTAKTEDGSISAHFEHTVVIENGVVTVVTL